MVKAKRVGNRVYTERVNVPLPAGTLSSVTEACRRHGCGLADYLRLGLARQLRADGLELPEELERCIP